MKLNVIVIDDSLVQLALSSRLIKKNEHLNLLGTFSDPFQGLRAANEQNVDVVLLDVEMPKIDGFELCKIIRDNPNTADIPFVFLTAKGELNDRVKGLNLGADDYISKPFHISEVTARIKSILQRRILAASEIEEEGETALKGNLQIIFYPVVNFLE